MRTYSMSGLVDFIVYFMNEETESILWDVWIHKERELSFVEFKSEYLKSNKQAVKLEPDAERMILENAAKIIKPRDPDGGEEN